MGHISALLFDADGVTITSGEPFSVRYAIKNGFDVAELRPFFSGDFQQAMLGKADLKDLLEKHRVAWHWQGEINELMKKWFDSENKPNQELVKEITQLRKAGIKCYLATNQEHYRTAFIRETMFPGVFDAIFSSAEIGSIKPSKEYFQTILVQLQKEGIEKSEIIYFDDSQNNVNAANELGIQSYLYTGIEDLHKVISPTNQA